MATTRMTPVGVLNFPEFFTPKANQANPNQAPRYSGMLVFDDDAVQSTAYAGLRAGVMEAIKEKFGDQKASDPDFVRSLQLPFKNAGEKDYTKDLGVISITAWTNGYSKDDKDRANALPAPGVVDLHGKELKVPGDTYSGQLARFTVRPFAYDSNGNKGVALGIEHVQIVKADMPRIDGRQNADKAFKTDGTDDELARLGIKAPSGKAADMNDFPF